MDIQIDTSQLSTLPVMSRKKFADQIGVTEHVVTGWINRGYLPVIDMGKYSLVNVALLTKFALEKEFSL